MKHLKDSSFLAKDGLSSQAFGCPAGSHRASAHDLRDSFQASKAVICKVDGMSKFSSSRLESRTFESRVEIYV